MRNHYQVLPIFLSFGLHGLLASFLIPTSQPNVTEQELPAIEVVWIENNNRKAPKAAKVIKDNDKSFLQLSSSLRALQRAERSNPVKKIVSATPAKTERQQSKTTDSSLKTNLKLNTGLLRPALSGARNDDGGLSQPSTSKPPYQPLPKYPWVCRKRGQEGRVSLLVQTNEEGRVIRASLHKSSGYASLDQSALNAVKTWSFVDGASQKILSFSFRLKG